MEIILHNIPTSYIEIAGIALGYGLGIATKFKQPIMLTMFLLRVLDWWIKNHPHGKEMADKTSLDDEFYRLFGIQIEKSKQILNGVTQEKLLSIGEAAKILNLSPQTLRLWDKQGKLKPLVAENGYRQYRLSDLRSIQEK